MTKTLLAALLAGLFSAPAQALIGVETCDTPGDAQDVAIDGGRAFVADGAAGLRIVDLADPCTGDVIVAMDARAVDVYEGRVYVGTGSGIVVLDPAAPTPALGSHPTTAAVLDLDVETYGGSGKIVVFAATGILEIVDMTNPASPVAGTNWDPSPGEAVTCVDGPSETAGYGFMCRASVAPNHFSSVFTMSGLNPFIDTYGDLELEGRATGVRVVGHYGGDILIHIHEGDRLRIVSIFDYVYDRPGWTFFLGGGGAVDVVGRQVYATNGSGVAILDLPTRSSLEQIGSVEFGAPPAAVAVGPTRMVTALGASGYGISDLVLRETGPPTTIGAGDAWDVAFSSDFSGFTYVADAPGRRVLQLRETSDGTASAAQSVSTPTPPVDIEVSGDFVFVAGGTFSAPFLNVYRDSTGLLFMGGTTHTGVSFIRDMEIAGSYAYMADSFSNIRVWDISSNPPVHLTTTPAGTTASLDVELDPAGTRLYAATGSSLKIYDVAGPVFTSRGTYSATGLGDVEILGTHAFAVSTAGLLVIDVSNPDVPALAGTFPSLQGSHLELDGNTLYIDDTDELIIVDVATPASPVELSRSAIPLSILVDGTGSDKRDLEVHDGQAYVTDGSMAIFDVATPTNPAILTVPDLSGTQVVRDGIAYLATGEIVDVRDEDRPRMLGAGIGGLNTSDVEVVGDLAFSTLALDSQFGFFQIHDVSDPENATLLYSHSGLFTLAPTDVEVVGQTAFVAAGTLQVYDASDTANVVSMPLPLAAVALEIVNDRAYVINGALYIYEIDESGFTDPTSPLAIHATLGVPSDVEMLGDLALVTEGSGGLTILDTSQPPGASHVANLSGFVADRVDLLDANVAITQSDASPPLGGFHLIDISDPSAPVELGTVPGPVIDGIAYGPRLYYLGEPDTPPFAFTRVADTGTTTPTGAKFTHFGALGGMPPLFDGNFATFLSADSDFGAGIFRGSGGPIETVVASGVDATTPHIHGPVGFDGGRVAFSTGIAIFEELAPGSTALVANSSTPAPAGLGSFINFQRGDHEGGTTAFRANTTLAGGALLRAESGALSVVADATTPFPAGGTIDQILNADLDGPDLAFEAFSLGAGLGALLLESGGVINPLVEQNDLAPSGGSFLGGIRLGGFDSGVAAFRATETPSLRGVYTTDTLGAVAEVARAGDPVPGRPGHVFSDVAPDRGGHIQLATEAGASAFTGIDDDGVIGVYTDLDLVLGKVADEGSRILGRRVVDIGVGPEGLAGNSLAVLAQLEDGSKGIYIADRVGAPVTRDLLGGSETVSMLGGVDSPGGFQADFQSSPGGTLTAELTRSGIDALKQAIQDTGSPPEIQGVDFLLPTEPMLLLELDTGGSPAGTVDLTIRYDPKSIVPPFDEDDLVVFHWNGTSWDELTGTPGPAPNTIIVQVSSFSPFFVGALPECQNDQDDDGDGLTDAADPGCDDPDDLSERSAALPCDDGIDNDGDLLPDFPLDPGCGTAGDLSESPQCQDGLNNDSAQDALIDFDGGASLDLDGDGFIDAAFNPATPAVTAADPQCQGDPARNRERKKKACGLGLELALLLPLLARRRRRASQRPARAA